jgi:hypothetical protein
MMNKVQEKIKDLRLVERRISVFPGGSRARKSKNSRPNDRANS